MVKNFEKIVDRNRDRHRDCRQFARRSFCELFLPERINDCVNKSVDEVRGKELRYKG